MPPTIISAVLEWTIMLCGAPNARPIAIRFGVPPVYNPIIMPLIFSALGIMSLKIKNAMQLTADTDTAMRTKEISAGLASFLSAL